MPVLDIGPSKGTMTANADRPTALLASPAEAAQAAEDMLRERYTRMEQLNRRLTVSVEEDSVYA